MTIMKEFDWRHLAIVYDTSDILMQVQGSALIKELRSDRSRPRPYDIAFDGSKSTNLDALLTEAAENARGTHQKEYFLLQSIS